MADVLVVGAGLAGLVAATALRGRGADVLLIDAGEQAGGRLATRRLGGATLDDGAQFFTVRHADFAELVECWQESGCPIGVWSHGFARAPSIASPPGAAEAQQDGHPRHIVRGGMQVLAAYLARGLGVRNACRVVAVRARPGGWEARTRQGEALTAHAVVLTPPLPQALPLIAAETLIERANTQLVADLRAVDYAPCLSLLAALDGAPGLPEPGGVQFDEGPVRFLADNATKQISPEPALTVHAAEAFSRTRADERDEAIREELLGLARPWLGGARVDRSELTRWRYAQPSPPREERAVTLIAASPDEVGPLVLAGDAFAGAKVEGAALSGLAAAELLGR
ncbi:MAG: NAD(P)/FAD-dependent oxidoreductase [Egibacteraceae bacterium]